MLQRKKIWLTQTQQPNTVWSVRIAKNVPPSSSAKHVLGIFVKCVEMNMKRKKLTHDHMVVPLTSNTLTKGEVQYCSKHTKKKLRYYCIPCGKPVCRKCIKQLHGGHAMKLFSSDVEQPERHRLSDEIKESLRKHAFDAIRMVDTVCSSTFPPQKKKEPSENDITQNNTPNKSSTCIIQQVYLLFRFGTY